MGYRSDIVIAFAFNTKEQVDEVLSIYQLHKFVQAHNLAKVWQVHEWGDMWGLTYHAESVKWYDTYEDVQGFEYMFEVVANFGKERDDFFYAYRKIRIGEDDVDIEHGSDDNIAEASSYRLVDELYDRVGVRRELITDF